MPLITDSIIAPGLAPGVSRTITHGVEQNGIAMVPNWFSCTMPWPLRVTAANNLTFTVINDDPVTSYDGLVRAMCLHSIQAPPGLSGVGQIMSIIGVSWSDKTSIVTSLTKHGGTCMLNRLRLLGAPGFIVEGDRVIIGADVYEFRDSSPPLGGTPGRMWVYNGSPGPANATISRANLIDAINGVVDAARITRTPQDPMAGHNHELVTALPGVTLGDITVVTTTAIGNGIRRPSGFATLTGKNLATITDVWDEPTMYGGVVAGQKNVDYATVTVLATQILKGNLQVEFPFTPTKFIVVNRLRSQNEAVAIVGNAVSITLGGGVSPNNQPADVLDVIAFG
jgi:hypothetical protein